MSSIKIEREGKTERRWEFTSSVHAIAGGTATWRPPLLSPASASMQEQGGHDL
jgi:hypothetical protein